MDVKVGSSPCSWGVWFGDDPRQAPWHRFLDEIVEAGYEWTELGVDYLEADIQRTGDGVLICFHEGNSRATSVVRVSFLS